MSSSARTSLSPEDAATAAAVRNYRRNSLAASLLHANILGGGPDAFDSARRRLSNVGDAVSRKISKSIHGWRPSVSVELTVSQGTALCGRYMRARLKRAGIFHRKLGLKRMQSAKILTASSSAVGDVYAELEAVGRELEKRHPGVYERIGKQVGCGIYFDSEQRAAAALTDVARELMRIGGECNWSKIVSLYAVSGGLAVDCVRQGKPEYLNAVQKAMGIVMETYLATWIQANGGWSAFALRYRPLPAKLDWQSNAVILIIVITVFVVFISIAVRLFLL